MRILFLCAALFAVACSPKVAEFEGGSLTKKDLEEATLMQRYELQKGEYDAFISAARTAAVKRILEIEGKKSGKTGEEFEAEELSKRFRPVDDATLELVYDQYKDQIGRPLNQIREQLKNQVNEQSKNQAKSDLYNSLLDKYGFKTVLTEPEAPRRKLDVGDDPATGPASAAVTIVEFSDFECPYCKRLQPSVLRLREEYKDKVRWVFKDFPLSFHPQAMGAHIAANCAGKQGKYFEYQTDVFAAPYNGQQLDLSPGFLIATARRHNLDLAGFQACLADADGSVRREIEADIRYGSEVGVTGTPAMFINGRFVNGVRPYEELKSLIEKEL